MSGPEHPVAPAGAVGPLETERTVLSYFRAFGPVPDWEELIRWPPDVFALANLVLDHTESYRFVVAPPAGRHWPSFPDWEARVRLAAHAWRVAGARRGCEPPALVQQCWDVVTRDRDVSLEKLRTGEAWETVTALLTLHAIADEACARIAPFRSCDAWFEGQAWAMLQAHGSLSRLSPARARIVPKTHFAERGITIRSVSRYLALSYESVEVRWRSVEPRPAERDEYNLVLVPWPLSVEASDFAPAPLGIIENMDPRHFEFFEFRPRGSPDSELVSSLLETAASEAGSVDAVIFPEAALHPGALAGLEQTLARHDATFLIAGVSQPPTPSAVGRNYLHFAVRNGARWDRYEQDKHHRWCLDEAQIRQYHLTRSLSPSRSWWEAIDVRERTLHVVNVGAGVTTAPLICEDLARLDEVADLVRRIGPTLVVALLLDGPQLARRWPCRYASVIADDPGSSVLTLTSFGMAARSRPPGTRRSRVVAHWNDRAAGIQEIELGPGAAAVLVQASIRRSTLWTADGRRHDQVPKLELAAVRQLRPSAAKVRRSHRRSARPPERHGASAQRGLSTRSAAGSAAR